MAQSRPCYTAAGPLRVRDPSSAPRSAGNVFILNGIATLRWKRPPLAGVPSTSTGTLMRPAMRRPTSLAAALFASALLAGVASAQPRFAAPFLAHDSGFDGRAVVVDHMSNDADLDVLVLSSLGLEVRLGAGDGLLGPATTLPVGTGRLLLIGNPNRDGVQDVLVAPDSIHVGLLIGNGDGTFQPMVSYAVPKAPVSGFFSNVDSDGTVDVLLVCEAESKVTVLLGNDHGAFIGRIDTPVAPFPTSSRAVTWTGTATST